MRRRWAAVAAVLALALAGCGGSSDEGEGDGETGNDPFFGVVSTDTPTAADLARMEQGGVGTYRVVLTWAAIEGVEGQYDWSGVDALLTQLAEHDIRPLFTLIGTPAVYQPTHIDPPTTDEKTFDAWADFLRAAAERYGSDGSFWAEAAEADPDAEPDPPLAWEIWNEPNTALFWAPAPDVDAYADLLVRSAKVLDEVDPDARVMIGGMFETPASDGAIVSYDFIRELYENEDVADAVDIVGVHPYAPDVESIIDQLDGTREAVDEAGDDASLWITEMGWSSDPAGPSDQAKTPEQQASLLEKSFTKLDERRDEWGLEGLVWFTWHDSTEPLGECVWCESAGLVDADRDTKPAWEAYARVAGGTP